ncbi:hypothetical protein DACRYDRAFT_20625 [Dacryopinax primogenitus]|uniref:Uncharacterized protein n=1 Tax=Dacryopinax primogenitus (strain DJM 731) TaxID=1858805 RepID=M5G8K5_DACPD|nr:uncharacterized protein DACRYDRAFT_20625 [Dacryopinax primogenitus]EJU05079.1 hypothetical protein DACRYDRAFT_20625 [Dacryopinax primogenitus]
MSRPPPSSLAVLLRELKMKKEQVESGNLMPPLMRSLPGGIGDEAERTGGAGDGGRIAGTEDIGGQQTISLGAGSSTTPQTLYPPPASSMPVFRVQTMAPSPTQAVDPNPRTSPVRSNTQSTPNPNPTSHALRNSPPNSIQLPPHQGSLYALRPSTPSPPILQPAENIAYMPFVNPLVTNLTPRIPTPASSSSPTGEGSISPSVPTVPPSAGAWPELPDLQSSAYPTPPAQSQPQPHAQGQQLPPPFTQAQLLPSSLNTHRPALAGQIPPSAHSLPTLSPQVQSQQRPRPRPQSRPQPQSSAGPSKPSSTRRKSASTRTPAGESSLSATRPRGRPNPARTRPPPIVTAQDSDLPWSPESMVTPQAHPTAWGALDAEAQAQAQFQTVSLAEVHARVQAQAQAQGQATGFTVVQIPGVNKRFMSFPLDPAFAKNEVTFTNLYSQLYEPQFALMALNQILRFFSNSLGWYFQSIPWAVVLAEQAMRAATYFRLQSTSQSFQFVNQLLPGIGTLMESLSKYAAAFLNTSTPANEQAPAATYFPSPLRVELWRRYNDLTSAWHEVNSRFDGGPQRAALILRESGRSTFVFANQNAAANWGISQPMPLSVSCGPYLDCIARVTKEEEERYLMGQVQAQQQLHQAQMRQQQRLYFQQDVQNTLQQGHLPGPLSVQTQIQATPSARSSLPLSARGSPAAQSPASLGSHSATPPSSIRIPQNKYIQSPNVPLAQMTPSIATGTVPAGRGQQSGRPAVTRAAPRTQVSHQQIPQTEAQRVIAVMSTHQQAVQAAVAAQGQLPSQIQITQDQFEKLQQLKEAHRRASGEAGTPTETAVPLTDPSGWPESPEPPFPPSVFQPVVNTEGGARPSAGGNVLHLRGTHVDAQRPVEHRAVSGSNQPPGSEVPPGASIPSVMAAPSRSPSQTQFPLKPPLTVPPSQSPETPRSPILTEADARRIREERRKRVEARKQKERQKLVLIDLTTPSPLKIKLEMDEDGSGIKPEASDGPITSPRPKKKRKSDTEVAFHAESSPDAPNSQSNLLGLTIGPQAIVRSSEESGKSSTPSTDNRERERPSLTPATTHSVEEQQWSIWNEPELPALRAFISAQAPGKSAAEIEQYLGSISRKSIKAGKFHLGETRHGDSKSVHVVFRTAQDHVGGQDPAILSAVKSGKLASPNPTDRLEEIGTGDNEVAMERLQTMERPVFMQQASFTEIGQATTSHIETGQQLKVSEKAASVVSPWGPLKQDSAQSSSEEPKGPVYSVSEEQSAEDMQLDKHYPSNLEPRELSPFTPVPSEFEDMEDLEDASTVEPDGLHNASDSENEQEEVELAVAARTMPVSEPPDTPPLDNSVHSSLTPFVESGVHTERTEDDRCKDCVAIMENKTLKLATEHGRFPNFPLPEQQSERWHCFEWDSGPPEPGRIEWNWSFFLTKEETEATRRWAQRFDAFDPTAPHLIIQLGVYNAEQLREHFLQQAEADKPMDVVGIPCSFPPTGLYGMLNDSTDHKFGISLWRHPSAEAIDLSNSVGEGLNKIKINAAKLWEDKTIILERRWPSEEEWDEIVEWYHRGEKMLLDHVSALWNMKLDGEDKIPSASMLAETTTERWWERYKGKTPIVAASSAAVI